MTHLTTDLRAFLKRAWRDRRGATAVTVALFMTVIIGMMGFVIDLGHVMTVKRSLQSSADSAALAGARTLNCCTTSSAIATTNLYSATWTSSTVVGSNKNADPNLYVQNVTGYPVRKCLTSVGISCAGVDPYNAVQVKQTTDVPMWFASIFGLSSIPVTATATAAGSGGSAQSFDIEIVVDPTASMNSADAGCTISGASRLTCAMAGVRTLLGELSPSADYIGLMTFPGTTTSTEAAKDYDCSGTTPTVQPYKSSPVYQILGLSHDFKASATATTLAPTSNLVMAAGGKSGCTGMTAVGGVGTFYADAITAAQADLAANGRTGVQKVIILLSDGDATATSANMPTGRSTNQCHQAITAASTATTAGTRIYTIAYGAPTSSTTSCTTDTTHISACSTLSQMASNPSMFYSDENGGCTSSAHTGLTELVSIFNSIGQSFMAPRLIPDNTT